MHILLISSVGTVLTSGRGAVDSTILATSSRQPLSSTSAKSRFSGYLTACCPVCCCPALWKAIALTGCTDGPGLYAPLLLWS